MSAAETLIKKEKIKVIWTTAKPKTVRLETVIFIQDTKAYSYFLNYRNTLSSIALSFYSQLSKILGILEGKSRKVLILEK